MKEALDAYVKQLEARVRIYQKRAEYNHEVNYAAAIALCRVVGGVTGEQRWDAYERIQQEHLARALD